MWQQEVVPEHCLSATGTTPKWLWVPTDCTHGDTAVATTLPDQPLSVAQRWWLVSSGAWLPVPSGQGAFPSHRLPSSCRLVRPVPIPVPAASSPAPQGPPVPQLPPSCLLGHPLRVPYIPKTPPSALSPRPGCASICGQDAVARRGQGWWWPHAHRCHHPWIRPPVFPGSMVPQHKGTPRLCRAAMAPALHKAPFSCLGKAPGTWPLPREGSWPSVLPHHWPTGGKRPPKLSAHVTSDMAMLMQPWPWQDQAPLELGRGSSVLSSGQAPVATSQHFYRPTGVERTLEASAI